MKNLIIAECEEIIKILKTASKDELKGKYGFTNKRSGLCRKMKDLRQNMIEYEKTLYDWRS